MLETTLQVHLTSEVLIEVLESCDYLQSLELPSASIIEALLSLLEGVLQSHIANDIIVNSVTDKLKAVFSVQNFDESPFIDNLEGVLARVELQLLKLLLRQVLEVESEWIKGLSLVPLKEGFGFLNNLVILLRNNQLFSQ